MADEEKLPQGFKWAYFMCKAHGNVARRMYQPYSLSNPIIGNMPSCSCSAHPQDKMIYEISKVSYDLRIAQKKMMPVDQFSEKLAESISKIPTIDGKVEIVKIDDDAQRAVMSVLVPGNDDHPEASRFLVEIKRSP